VGPKVAIDVPSGLHADTGQVLGVACDVDVTVTFVGRKRGMLLGAGPAHCGRVFVADLGLP
jgi:NAD(P)H-hydrate epimerase